MRPKIAKWILVIPSLLFLDWIIMIIVGCISNACGANDKYFCTVFCNVGIVILTLTLLAMVFLIYKKNFQRKLKG